MIECAGRKKMIQSEPTFFRSPFSRSKEETSDPEAMFSYEELQGEQDYPRLLHENGRSQQPTNKKKNPKIAQVLKGTRMPPFFWNSTAFIKKKPALY